MNFISISVAKVTRSFGLLGLCGEIHEGVHDDEAEGVEKEQREC